jgi:hypothetical protein
LSCLAPSIHYETISVTQPPLEEHHAARPYCSAFCVTPEDTTPEDTTPEDTTPEDTTPEDITFFAASV